MADAMIGQPYTPYFVVYDVNGTLTTAASTVTGTLSVTGPGSTTVIATGAVTFQGSGAWGLAVAGTLLLTPGTYQFTVPDFVVNGTALGLQTGVFVVGIVQAGVRTLRDILVDLSLALADGLESKTTALGSTTTFTDTRWAVGQANELAGSEVLFLDRTSPVNNDTNPVTVSASTSAGLVTFTPANTANVASGTPYLIGGRSYPHQHKLAAIRQVLEDLGPLEYTSDRVTLTSVLNQYEYDVPAAFRTVTKVYRQAVTSLQPTMWFEMARGIRWQYLPDRRKLVFTPAAEIAQQRIRLEGLIETSLPTQLTSLVPLRAATVVRLAEVYLKIRGGDAADQRTLPQLYADLLRKGRIAARAGRPV